MKAKHPKIDTSAASTPLQADPFAALGGLSDLPPGREAVSNAALPAATSKSGPPRARLILRREKKDRGGKTVVVISGFDEAGFSESQIEDLARKLRRHLGCGGAMEEKEIMLQGDRPAAVAEILREWGFVPAGVVS